MNCHVCETEEHKEDRGTEPKQKSIKGDKKKEKNEMEVAGRNGLKNIALGSEKICLTQPERPVRKITNYT